MHGPNRTTLGFFEHDEKEFVNFLNGITCFIWYSKDRKSAGISGDGNILKKFHPQYVDLSKFLYFIKVRQSYKELKTKNTPWNDIFLELSSDIGDLLCEAVEEFEKKYDLPERY